MSSSTEVAERRKAWLDAAIRLGENPRAKVLCPQNKDAYLQVVDSEFSGGVERHMFCPGCHARESLLLKK
jgi:hypothetical protein